MPEKVIAVVPAFNEQEWIGKVLEPLNKARDMGIVHEVVVVNDGSTDNTAGIARKFGVTVLQHDKNLGKTQAFITAANYSGEHNADVMFMTDADMLNLTPEKIRKFLGHILAQNKIQMIVAPYLQGGDECLPRHSGFRAIKIKALEPLFRSNPKWMQYFSAGYGNYAEGETGKGFQLETALENLIPKNRVSDVDGLDLHSRIVYGGASKDTRVCGDIKAVSDARDRRSDTARRLRLLRELRRDPSLRDGKITYELLPSLRIHDCVTTTVGEYLGLPEKFTVEEIDRLSEKLREESNIFKTPKRETAK